MRLPCLLLSILINLSLFGQQKEIFSFIDPVVQTWTVDRKVNEKKALFASLEINGNLRVYDLHGRKPVFLDIQSEQELSETGNSNEGTINMLQFSADGAWMGYFDIRSGFQLYNTSTWVKELSFSWPGLKQENQEDYPSPGNIYFIGKYLVLYYQTEERVNNCFVFDLEKKTALSVFNSTGFHVFDMPEIIPGNEKQLELYFDKPSKFLPTNFTWRTSSKVETFLKGKGQILLITDESATLQTEPAEYSEEELTTRKDSSYLADDTITALLRNVIKDEYDIREHLMSNPIINHDTIWGGLSAMNFYVTGIDTIQQNIITRYQFADSSGYFLIEVARPGEYPRYYLHFDLTKKRFHFGNAYFIYQPAWDGLFLKGRWKMLSFSRNDFHITAFDVNNDDLLSLIATSPSGKEIAFAVNAYRSAIIYGFALDSSQPVQLLRLKGKRVSEDWLREDGFASYQQLSIYKFLENGYLFFQGKDLHLNNLLFETKYWSNILELPVASALKEQSGYGFKNIFRDNETILMGSLNSWNYRENIFAYTPIIRDSLGANDFVEISPATYYNTDQQYLKRLQLKYDKLQKKIWLGDKTEFITIRRDDNSRMIWTHNKENMSLQYYPSYTWLDISSSDTEDSSFVGDPNIYADNRIGRHVLLKNSKGETYTLKSPYGPSTGFVKACFSQDGKYVFTLGGHHYIDVWKTDNGQYLATIIPDGALNFTIIDSDQHFYTRDISSLKHIYTSVNGKVYPAIEMLEFQNRPDLVMSKLGFIDNPQLLAFYKSWAASKKSRNDIADLTSSKRPSVHINESVLPLATADSTVQLYFTTSGSARIAKLWINNILVDSQVVTTASSHFNCILQKGANKIQIAVTDNNNVQSLRETCYLNFQPTASTISEYGILLGVSNYSNSSNNLEFAVKDAQALAKTLEMKSDGKIVTLVNEKVTTDNLRSVARSMDNQSTNDLAILYLAGHGALDSDGNFYFCTSTTDLENPAARGISMKQLQAVFSTFKARKRLLILDACHSGNASFQVYDSTRDSNSDETHLTKRGLRTIRSNTAKQVSERNYAEIIRQQLTDVTDESGVIVVSATSGNGVAFESPVWNNGVFTSVLIKALRTDEADRDGDKKLAIQELVDYVISEVKRITKDKQVPESTTITSDKNWIVIDY